MDELKNFGFIPNGGRTYCMYLTRNRDSIHAEFA